MKVALAELVADHAGARAELDAAIGRVIDSGHFIGGPEVEAFERELAASVGAARAIGTSSGTDALLVALMALDVGVGDEVVTTPFSFFATAGAIARLGARPVFADVDEDFNLDPAAAVAVVTSRTRAIVTVNLYGRLAALPVTPLPIIEDSAQSIGAGPVRGLVAAMSFFPTKNLGAMGDAGAVLTDDGALADRVALLRNHGARPKYTHHQVGGNFRLDALQAAILRVKLARLAGWTAARRANAARYRELLAPIAQVVPPRDSPEHVYHHFVIRAERRDALRDALTKAGVATEVYYPLPLHLQPCFAELAYRPGSMPRAEAASREALALPVHPSVTAEQQRHVVAAIAAFYGVARPG
jgi:dTDP-4-amino-4,6-dideoxygalactose transaminase